MHPKDLKPVDCASVGMPDRSAAIRQANVLTRVNDAQHTVIKIDGLWYVYDRVKHHPLSRKEKAYLTKVSK